MFFYFSVVPTTTGRMTRGGSTTMTTQHTQTFGKKILNQGGGKEPDLVVSTVGSGILFACFSTVEYVPTI